MSTPFSFGPVAMSATLTTNILNPPTTTGGVGIPATHYAKTRIRLRRIRILNKTASPATFSLWIGGTGGNVAGTEFLGTGLTVPANGGVEYSMLKVLTTSDFLVGGASAGSTLTIEGDGDIEVGA